MADLDVTYIMDFLIENHVVDNQILEVINSMVSFDEMLYLPDMPNPTSADLWLQPLCSVVYLFDSLQLKIELVVYLKFFQVEDHKHSRCLLMHWGKIMIGLQIL